MLELLKHAHDVSDELGKSSSSSNVLF